MQKTPNQIAKEDIILDLFKDWQNFASTPCGFIFTLGAAILGVAAFIALSQYQMPLIGAIAFSGAVFGDFAIGLVAGKLKKHGFFGDGVCGSSLNQELNVKPVI